MNLFKRKKPTGISAKTSALAERIAALIIRRQSQIANYLNRKTAYWNTASKLIALALFCLLFGGACLYFIIKSI